MWKGLTSLIKACKLRCALPVQNGMNGMQEVLTCNVTSTMADQPGACGRGYVCAPLPQADVKAASAAAASASSWGLSPAPNAFQGETPH